MHWVTEWETFFGLFGLFSRVMTCLRNMRRTTWWNPLIVYWWRQRRNFWGDFILFERLSQRYLLNHIHTIICCSSDACGIIIVHKYSGKKLSYDKFCCFLQYRKQLINSGLARHKTRSWSRIFVWYNFLTSWTIFKRNALNS